MGARNCLPCGGEACRFYDAESGACNFDAIDAERVKKREHIINKLKRDGRAVK